MVSDTVGFTSPGGRRLFRRVGLQARGAASTSTSPRSGD